MTIYAAQVGPGGFRDLLIADRTNPSTPLVTFSRSGRLEAGQDGGLRLVLEDGEIHREDPSARDYVVARFARATADLGLGAALDARNRSRTTLRARPGGDPPEVLVGRRREPAVLADLPLAAHRGAARHPGAGVAGGAHRVPPAGRARLRVRGVDPLHRRLLRPPAPGRGARARRACCRRGWRQPGQPGGRRRRRGAPRASWRGGARGRSGDPLPPPGAPGPPRLPGRAPRRRGALRGGGVRRGGEPLPGRGRPPGRTASVPVPRRGGGLADRAGRDAARRLADRHRDPAHPRVRRDAGARARALAGGGAGAGGGPAGGRRDGGLRRPVRGRGGRARRRDQGVARARAPPPGAAGRGARPGSAAGTGSASTSCGRPARTARSSGSPCSSWGPTSAYPPARRRPHDPRSPGRLDPGGGGGAAVPPRGRHVARAGGAAQLPVRRGPHGLRGPPGGRPR